MNTRATAASRPTILIAALAAIALSMLYLARPVAATEPYHVDLHESHQGADSTDFKEDEDCGDFTTGVVWHFILNQYDGNDTAHLVADFEDAGTLEVDAGPVNPGVQHFYINTPTDDVLNDAYAEVAQLDGDANLVLSHVCHTGEEQSQSQSESESQSQSESESESQSQSESESESQSQSGEQSVEAGTGTPAESQPDTAMSFGGSNPLPTVAFGLILLASLAGLAFANVKASRNRS